MATERKWESVPPQAVLSDGSPDGLIAVSNPGIFKVKQIVKLFSDSTSPINYQVKRVIPEGIILGDPTKGIDVYSNMNQWLLNDNSMVSADEQVRPTIIPDAYNRAMFEEEPTVAQRSVLVDSLGRKIDSVVGDDGKVKLATDAAVTLSGVTIDVALDAFTGPAPDNVQIVGSENGQKTGTKHGVRVDSDLDLRAGISDGANKAQVNATRELSVVDVDARTQLASILTKLGTVLKVDDDETQIVLASILTKLGTIIKVDDDETQAKLDIINSNLIDIESAVNSGSANVVNEISQANSDINDNLDQMDANLGTKLDTIEATLTTLDVDTFWAKLSKSIDRSRISSYSDVVVSGRTLKRLDYVEYSAASVSVSQKIRVSYTWLDFGTKDERVGPITRSVLSI